MCAGKRNDIFYPCIWIYACDIATNIQRISFILTYFLYIFKITCKKFPLIHFLYYKIILSPFRLYFNPSISFHADVFWSKINKKSHAKKIHLWHSFYYSRCSALLSCLFVIYFFVSTRNISIGRQKIMNNPNSLY